MQVPELAAIAAIASRRAPSPAATAAFVTALTESLGMARVSTVTAVRAAASTDYAHLSPLLSAVLPSRHADVVVRPRSAAEVVAAVRLAYEHDIPVVPRGRGTGNYGQAVPLAAGLVLDLTGLDQIVEVGDGWVRAGAGATFVALETAARRTGQEIAMLPTTVGSTIGGFLGGGAGGLGSIEHGFLWDGFVHALAVVTCPPGDGPLEVAGASCLPYLHAYGVTGIIVAATVALSPARERTSILASFSSFDSAVQCGQNLMQLDPLPRLISVDDPGLVATYPADAAIPLGRFSVRASVGVTTVEAVQDLVAAGGGRLEAIRPHTENYLSTLAFNHVTLRAQRTRPELCHLQVGGEALLTRADEVRAALPGALLHFDGMRMGGEPGFGGLLLSEFQTAEVLYEGIERLQALGVHVVDPHTWLLGGPALPAIQSLAATNDPKGLLNPGKLPG